MGHTGEFVAERNEFLGRVSDIRFVRKHPQPRLRVAYGLQHNILIESRLHPQQRLILAGRPQQPIRIHFTTHEARSTDRIRRARGLRIGVAFCRPFLTSVRDDQDEEVGKRGVHSIHHALHHVSIVLFRVVNLREYV